MAIRQIGKPPFQVYTNLKLDVMLVSKTLPIKDEWEISGWSLSWSLFDMPGVTYMELTPRYLAALRERYKGVNTQATAEFASVLSEHWQS